MSLIIPIIVIIIVIMWIAFGEGDIERGQRKLKELENLRLESLAERQLIKDQKSITTQRRREEKARRKEEARKQMRARPPLVEELNDKDIKF